MNAIFAKKRDISNLVDLLIYRAEKQPDKTAYIFLADGESEEAKLTYKALNEQSRAIAAELQKRFQPGDRALLLYPSGLEFISAFFGCLYAGIVAVPCYPPDSRKLEISMDKLRGIIADCSPEVILTAKELLDLSAFISPDYPDLEKMSRLASDMVDVGLAFDWKNPAIDGKTLAFLQYTSGSTGVPKGVMVSHGNVLYNEKMYQTSVRHTDKAIFAGWIPLYHDMGLIGNILHSVYLGCLCVFMSSESFLQKPVRWLRTISKYKATISCAPNFAFDLCSKKVAQEQMSEIDLSSWEIALNGAEPVKSETLKLFFDTFKEYGFRKEAFQPCLGMAEATLFVSGGLKDAPPVIEYIDKNALKQNKALYLDANEEGSSAVVGCGRTWLEQKIIIVDPDAWTRRSDNQTGEIWVSGPNVAQGYWNKPELTKKNFQARLSDTGESPFLRTGDLGFMKDGELFVTGRIKDLIIVRGQNYYPQDIESTVEKSHPSLRLGCSAAFAVEAGNEERLVVVQELKAQRPEDFDASEALKAIRKAVFSRHGLPVYAAALLEAGNIPKTSSGKIQRYLCKEMFLQKRFKLIAEWKEDLAEQTAGEDIPVAAPETRMSGQAIQDWITASVAQEFGIPTREIHVDEPLSNYALDSLRLMNIIAKLEEWLGKPISPTLLYTYPNITELSRYLSGERQAIHSNEKPSAPRSREAIAIVGAACRFPGAENPDSFWRLVCEKTDAITEVEPFRWNINAFYYPDSAPGKMNSRWGGFLKQAQIESFDAAFFGVAPREAKAMDPQQRLLLELSWEALENANLNPQKLRGSKTGVFIGVCANDYSRLQVDYAELNAYCGIGNAFSVAANRLSYFFDFRGPSFAVDTACSSSLTAIHQACRSLRSGESELALSGGVNVILDPKTTVVFSQARMMAPDGRCKTFDAAADGYVRGEGCGIVALKRLSDAVRDKDNILAVIQGSAINQDGHSNGLTAPSVGAQSEVIRQALEDAQARPSQIGFVETHGTGTALGDPIEVQALKEVLTQDRPPEQTCRLGAVKTNIGHLEGAAGVAGLIKTALCLHHKKIPANLHFKELNPLIPIKDTPLQIPTELAKWPQEKGSRLAGVNSFGFGGANAHVILREAPTSPKASNEDPSGPALERPAHILAVSAKTEQALSDLAAKYIKFLDARPDISLADICHSANTGRAQFERRLAVVAESSQELCKQLRAFVDGESSVAAFSGQALDKEPEIAFLFTGQGSQYPGMGKELYETQPVFRKTMNQCAKILEAYLDKSPLEIIFGETHNAADDPDDTSRAQPALFALEYSLFKLWESWGVKPSVVMGHSVGEYAAACAAGVFSLEDGLKLVAERGRLMRELSQNGGMLSAAASQKQAERIIQPFLDQVSIAALNGPESVVISGHKKALEIVAAGLKAQGVKNVNALRVSRAFHSPLIEPMIGEFKQVLRSIKFSAPKLKLISNLTGQEAADEISAPEYWTRHTREPVRFVSGLETLNELGYDALLECGPKPILLGMVAGSLTPRQKLRLPSLRSANKDWGPILRSLSELYAHGASVDWSGFDDGYSRQKVALPNYAWQRKKYWVGEKYTTLGEQPDSHPLLGRKLLVAGRREGASFESLLSPEAPAYLADHRVCDAVVFPGAGFLEMALVAAAIYFKADQAELSDVMIARPLIFPEDGVKRVQVSLDASQEAAQCEFKIFSLNESDKDDGEWILHSAGKAALRNPEIIPAQIDLPDIRSRLTDEKPSEIFYQKLYEHNLDYGPSFRALKRIWQGEGEALGLLETPKKLLVDLNDHLLHPALLDSALQVAGLALPPDTMGTYLPIGVEKLRFYQRPKARMWCRAVYKNGDSSEETIKFKELRLFTENGEPAADLEGFLLKKIDLSAVFPEIKQQDDDWLFRTNWIPKEKKLDEPLIIAQPKHWLIFSDRRGVGQELAELLKKRGHISSLVFRGETYEQINEREFKVNPDIKADFEMLLARLNQDISKSEEYSNKAPTSIIHLWSIDKEKERASAEETTLEDLNAASKNGCLSVLNLTQALLKAEFPAQPAIWLVTQNSQAVASDSDDETEMSSLSIAQSPLWGMGRTMALERPDLLAGMVDLDLGEPAALANDLLNEIQSPDGENHIAFRNNLRYAARLERREASSASRELEIPENQAYQLKISEYGLIDNLCLKPMRRVEPQAEEVEIQVKAAGLNLRDVLNALGMLKEYYAEYFGVSKAEDLSFGFECAGKISAIGKNVSAFQVGDEVMATLTHNALSSFVAIPAEYVCLKPEHLSFEEAATIPLVFLTAFYGLERLAKIRPGEKILIHAAAGGVGLAAIQMARLKGAEIYATASVGKWEYLKSLGIKHTMNSRSLDFADEIMKLTKGQGVDVALNSLSGDFIAKSFECLGKNGRFVEIGKIDMWSEEKVKKVRPDAAYFPFDLGAAALENPGLIKEMLARIRAGFKRGELRPLPRKVFFIQDAVKAFRYMQRARHVGKIAISLPDANKSENSAIPVEANSAYLITGGLGGLGLKTARWLAGQGAKHLALAGRRGLSDDNVAAKAVVERMRQNGVEVAVVKIDVSDQAATAEALAMIKKSLPPLKGVFHAAGLIDDGVLEQLSPEKFTKVMAPKIQGTWNLHKLTRDCPLDFFVCFSSIASMLGSPGQANYAAANAFMDGLAYYRRALGLPAISVNWGPWAEVGLAASLNEAAQTRVSRMMKRVTPELGLRIMKQTLSMDVAQVGVMSINWPAWLKIFPADKIPPLFSRQIRGQIKTGHGKKTGVLKKLKDASGHECQEILLEYLQTEIAKILGAESSHALDPRKNFFEMGMDSLMAMEFKSRIEFDLECSLEAGATIEFSTVEGLAEYLARRLDLENIKKSSSSEDEGERFEI